MVSLKGLKLHQLGPRCIRLLIIWIPTFLAVLQTQTLLFVLRLFSQNFLNGIVLFKQCTATMILLSKSIAKYCK